MDQEKQKNMLQNIPYIQFNGIVIDRIGMEESVLYVDMRHELENPYGMAHGGLLFTLVETAGGVTARAREGLNYNKPEPPYTKSIQVRESDKAPENVRSWTVEFSVDEVQAALDAGGHDNITAMAVFTEEDRR